MDVWVRGQGKVSLGQGDFVGQGGEASVYARGDTAYKVYPDPGRMIPEAKIQELAALTLPNILRPQAVLLDSRNRPIGYTMRRVRDAHVLCQVFNRAFRERHGLTPDAMLALVRKLQDGVRHVHEQRILIVDLNEMNFLLDPAFREVLFIDTDSYQTPGFPATALMESIRDRHALRFSEETDWFAFAVVSFQMFVGIHPYKGRHPSLSDLDARMLANVSVLNREVTLPLVCYPFEAIPQLYREWYRAVLEEGKRLPPPQDLLGRVILMPLTRTVCAGDQLIVQELFRFPAEIMYPVSGGRAPAALTATGFCSGTRCQAAAPDARFGRTPRMNHLIAARLEAERLTLFDLTAGQPIRADFHGDGLTVSGDRLYLKDGERLSQLEFVETPGATLPALRPVANVLPQATLLCEGAAIQNLLGSWYATLLPGPGEAFSIRLAELDGFRVVEARFENRVLMVIGTRDGRYDRFLFRFGERFRDYDVRVAADVPVTGLNFTVLDSGVCLHLNENEELEVFSNRKDSSQLKVIADPGPGICGARLFKDGTRALLCRGDTLYQVSLRV